VTAIDGEVVGTGRARGFPDGAIGAARFLFELLAQRAIPLEAGQWISSGAVTGVHDALARAAHRGPLRRRVRGRLPAGGGRGG
jgi:2-keto-4-pentenoate hydratase